MPDEVMGQRHTAAYMQRSEIMSVSTSLLLGIIAGIVLFIVLERTGVVYRWFDKWDGHK